MSDHLYKVKLTFDSTSLPYRQAIETFVANGGDPLEFENGLAKAFSEQIKALLDDSTDDGIRVDVELVDLNHEEEDIDD